MHLGFGVAVAVAWAGSCSSGVAPSLGTFICHTFVPKKKKKKDMHTKTIKKTHEIVGNWQISTNLITYLV